MSRTRTGAKALGAVGLGAALSLSMLSPASGSSHREAPLITEDPVIDNTDVYAFMDPATPGMVNLVASYIPFQEPSQGPNFYNFGTDAMYEILVDNDGDAADDVKYQFRFRTEFGTEDTFLYNTGPITSLDDPDFNYRQYYTVTRVTDGKREVIGEDLPVPPVNIGPRSTPDYEELAASAVHTLDGGTKVFAGQRDDSFFIDIGSGFDLLGLRPLNPAHTLPLPASEGIDNLAGYNVHSIALQVPLSDLVHDGEPVIGVWSVTKRRQTRVYSGVPPLTGSMLKHTGEWVQVSRLGNPLVNEVVIPLKDKDRFNGTKPVFDKMFAEYVVEPELGTLIPSLYPVFDCFPSGPRDDLVAVYLTGIPGLNQPQHVQPAELLRLNTAMPSGFPNGRLPSDDVHDLSLQAVAGAALPVQECFGQAPNNALTDGVDTNDKEFLSSFPYIATPHQGYESDQNGTIPAPPQP